MRKKEEDLYKTKLEWVRAHRFPEDKINDWFEERNIKTTKSFHDTHQRCRICNYSSSGLHDQAYVSYTGRYKRSMYKDGTDWLCEYCYRPMSQWYEREAIEKAIAEFENMDEFKRAKKYAKEQQSEKEIV